MDSFPASSSLWLCCEFWEKVILPGLSKARNTVGSGMKGESKLNQ